MKFSFWTATIILIIFETAAEQSSLLNKIIAQRDPSLIQTADKKNGTQYLTELVKQHGYPVEEHEVITEDGYILTFFRIPDSPRSNNTRQSKPIVYLQHGAYSSPEVWVMLGPETSLAFLLADAGYDVWLGSLRGTIHGQYHIKFSISDKEFWQFSYHEHAIYDLPALIDYVLDYTKSKELNYIGYSMGTTMSYVLLSTKPSYNKKLRFVISLAPVAYWVKTAVPPVIRFLIRATTDVEPYLEEKGIYGIVPYSNLLSLMSKLCSRESIVQPLCAALLFSVFGNDPAQLSLAAADKFILYYPGGGSLKVVYHYAQNFNTEKFQAYDYGYEGNIKRYNQKVPPEYDVKKISTPVALIYGENDALASVESVLKLYKRLPNVPIVEAVPYRYFSHADFVIATDVRKLLNDRIVNLLKLSYVKNNNS